MNILLKALKNRDYTIRRVQNVPRVGDKIYLIGKLYTVKEVAWWPPVDAIAGLVILDGKALTKFELIDLMIDATLFVD
jgi:hypothetical protein